MTNRTYALLLNNGKPLRLRSSPPINLDLGQHFRVIPERTIGDASYRVQIVKYFYAFSTPDEQELLNFQWTPQEGYLPGRRTFPHVHIGRGLLGDHAAIFPDTFHKKHVPTGRVSFESIIRFAIEELEVPPLRANWRARLNRGEA